MPIVGIDLGTTNSCVSIIEGGSPVVIPNDEGSRITPSVVAFTDDGSRFAGAVAKRQAVVNPRSTIFGVKRLVGRKINSPEVDKAKEFAPYEIISNENEDAWVEVNDKQYSPQEISSIILMKMKNIAEEYLGYEVDEAVITVPAHFNDSQRQATKDAGRIAGFNVRRIINEPTAAALAYGFDKKENQKVAVFDLGGGTFDISILEINNGVFEVKATSGDTFLGGDDFDQKLINLVIEDFQNQHSIDLKTDKMALQRIREASEKAKHELSSLLETNINLPFVAVDTSGPQHLNIKINRDQFEQMVADLIDRLDEPCLQALQDAKLDASEIDEVVSVGGMTRMPKVSDKVRQLFNKDPQTRINPDEVVAIGAAVQGGILEGQIDEVILLDVVPLSLGVETRGSLCTKIIERNTTIPTKRSRIFTTALDNQDFVNIHVLQGEREMADDNISLAKLNLIGIPPAPRGIPQIEVSFEVDADGILNVSARDLGTGKKQAIQVETSGGLSEGQIKLIIEEGKKHVEEDKMKKEFADIKNEAEGLLFSVDKTLTSYSDKAEEGFIDLVRDARDKMKEALSSQDFDEIKTALETLKECSYAFAEIIYSKKENKTEYQQDTDS
ncbi:MAG TPA: molecular chaperone DnaK [Thermodesulfobacteriota bacterium]|nr:molecular chaperone DnaK [Thermodesulfobacteriota bacterium]